MAQVQVRTVLQHAWAEFEHDIRYKGTVPAEHARDFDRRFTLAAGLLELADQEFTTIRERLRGGPVAEPEPRAGRRAASAPASWPPTSPGSTRTPSGRAPTTTLDRRSGAELGITSLAELGEVLREGRRRDAITARMDYRYPPGAVRRLDDALLARFGAGYIGLRQRPPPSAADGPAGTDAERNAGGRRDRRAHCSWSVGRISTSLTATCLGRVTT